MPCLLAQITAHNGEILLVSQFTLYARLKKPRPDFSKAMPPNQVLFVAPSYQSSNNVTWKGPSSYLSIHKLHVPVFVVWHYQGNHCGCHTAFSHANLALMVFRQESFMSSLWNGWRTSMWRIKWRMESLEVRTVVLSYFIEAMDLAGTFLFSSCSCSHDECDVRKWWTGDLYPWQRGRSQLTINIAFPLKGLMAL